MDPARARVDDRWTPHARRHRGDLPDHSHADRPTHLFSARRNGRREWSAHAHQLHGRGRPHRDPGSCQLCNVGPLGKGAAAARPKHACAPTTALVWAGAREGQNPGTPGRSPANSIRCSRVLTLKAPTCWWVIPTAACTRRCTLPGTQSRLRAWSWSTPRTPSSSRVLQKDERCTNKPGGWVLSFLG